MVESRNQMKVIVRARYEREYETDRCQSMMNTLDFVKNVGLWGTWVA